METQELPAIKKEDLENNPIIVVQRAYPKDPKSNSEGLKLLLDKDGNLDPNLLEGFIVDMSVSMLKPARTVILTTRLVNNFIINTTAVANTLEEFNENVLIEEAKAKMLMELFNHLRFLWHCATADMGKLMEDLKAQRESQSKEEPAQ